MTRLRRSGLPHRLAVEENTFVQHQIWLIRQDKVGNDDDDDDDDDDAAAAAGRCTVVGVPSEGAKE
jgi:hypothetical protein